MYNNILIGQIGALSSSISSKNKRALIELPLG